MKSKFDYVIIDTPPTFSSINIILVFLETELIVVPFEAERANVEGAINVINEISKSRYVNKPLIYFLPNKIQNWIDLELEVLNNMISNIQKKKMCLCQNFKYLTHVNTKMLFLIEKIPLMLSDIKNQTINTQKALMIEITKEILNLLNKSYKNSSTKKEDLIFSKLDKILNKNFEKYLEKVTKKYSKNFYKVFCTMYISFYKSLFLNNSRLIISTILFIFFSLSSSRE